MENKYSNYDFREKVNLNFAVAYCVSGKIFRKLPNGFKPSKEIDEVEKFKTQHEANGETVVVEYFAINDSNIYSAFLNYFWSQLTAAERENVLYAACKKYTGKEFVRTLNTKETHPFYADENGYYLNSSVLNSTMHPSEILGLLFCLPFEERKYKFDKQKSRKNILEFKDFEELCFDKYVEGLFSKMLKNLSKQQVEYAEMDSVSARAYREAGAEAFDVLMEEGLFLSYLPSKDLNYIEQKLQKLAGVSELIDSKLESYSLDRDMELIKKANDHFNKIAIKEGRFDDVVEEAKAFEHFGYTFTIDFDEEEQPEDDDEPQYQA